MSSGGFGVGFGWRAEATSIAALRERARKALPQMVWTYLECGAEDHVTLEENLAAFRDWRLRPRVLTGHSSPDLATEIAGVGVALPLALAPVGLTGLFHRHGDVAAARAAEAAGTRLVLSTSSSWSLEEVAEATDRQHWFQLYPYGDRAMVGALVDRAMAAGYSALFVTVDAPVKGNRERERESGMTVPVRLTVRTMADAALHPRWCHDLLRYRRATAIHYAQAGASGVTAAIAAAAAIERHMQGDLNWVDLAWLRDRWPGRLYVKGVLHPDDAVRAIVEIGADGVVVSNHGGRQLDRAQGTLNALPSIAAAVAGRGAVYLDGGIRRGSDVVTALALGADAVMIGRAYAYGLAAAGERGVSAVLSQLRDEIRRTMTLIGCPDVRSLGRDWLVPTHGESR